MSIMTGLSFWDSFITEAWYWSLVVFVSLALLTASGVREFDRFRMIIVMLAMYILIIGIGFSFDVIASSFIMIAPLALLTGLMSTRGPQSLNSVAIMATACAVVVSLGLIYLFVIADLRRPAWGVTDNGVLATQILVAWFFLVLVWRPPFALLLTVILSLGFFITWSRITILVSVPLVAFIAFASVSRRDRYIVRQLVGVFGSLIGVLSYNHFVFGYFAYSTTSRLASANSRTSIWYDYLLGWKADFAFNGIGLGTFSQLYSSVRTEWVTEGVLMHSDMVQFMIEGGVLLWLLIIGVPIVLALRKAFAVLANVRKSSNLDVLLVVVIGAISGVGLANFSFYSPFLAYIWGVAFALLLPRKPSFLQLTSSMAVTLKGVYLIGIFAMVFFAAVAFVNITAKEHFDRAWWGHASRLTSFLVEDPKRLEQMVNDPLADPVTTDRIIMEAIEQRPYASYLYLLRAYSLSHLGYNPYASAIRAIELDPSSYHSFRAALAGELNSDRERTLSALFNNSGFCGLRFNGDILGFFELAKRFESMPEEDLLAMEYALESDYMEALNIYVASERYKLKCLPKHRDFFEVYSLLN